MANPDTALEPRTGVPHAGGPNALAAWLLGGPLTAGVLAVGLFFLATWVPHYLTWPLWSDSDAFAEMAQGWDMGRLPYRDVVGFNFPGQTYLFWALGRAFGWGHPVAFQAMDAEFLLTLGGVLLVWSRRRFGRLLPGAIGYLAFITYYMGLDFSGTAQRDWHAAFLAGLAVLLPETRAGRPARLASALLAAASLAFRPHAALFLPAVVMAVGEGATAGDRDRRSIAPALLEWSLAFLVGLLLAFSPLIAGGLIDDFARGVRLAAYGGNYSKVTAEQVITRLAGQFLQLEVLFALASLWLLGGPARMRAPGPPRTWAVALLAMLFYSPFHPLGHAYLKHPLMLVWSVNLAVISALLLGRIDLSHSIRLWGILAVLVLAIPGKPEFCSTIRSVRAIGPLLRGDLTEQVPPGARNYFPDDGTARYPWPDYRRMIAYLRESTDQHTRLVAILPGDVREHAPFAAVNGMVGRVSLFPYESGATWLWMVNPDLEGRFADILAGAGGDSVVVWVPDADGFDRDHEFPRLRRAILDHYAREARFGRIEVWRRRTGAGAP